MWRRRKKKNSQDTATIYETPKPSPPALRQVFHRCSELRLGHVTWLHGQHCGPPEKEEDEEEEEE